MVRWRNDSMVFILQVQQPSLWYFSLTSRMMRGSPVLAVLETVFVVEAEAWHPNPERDMYTTKHEEVPKETANSRLLTVVHRPAGATSEIELPSFLQIFRVFYPFARSQTYVVSMHYDLHASA
jgi:hypothetical protein